MRCRSRTRRLKAVAAAAAVAVASCARPAADDQRAGVVTLSIVATNDLHGAVLPREGRGGLDVLAGYLSNLQAARAADGGVVLVDAGDMFQGTLESNLGEGASVVAAYNALGYAAAAIGNHEFDFGISGPGVAARRPGDDPRGALKARAREASFPLLAANLLDAATAQPVEWPNVRPSVVIERAGVRVGIIGVMTRNALSATIATATRGLRIGALAPSITREAAALRREGATVIVVAAHAGGRCTRFDDPTDLSSCDLSDAEILNVAGDLPAGTVDVIASGHTHAGVAHVVQGTIVMQAFASGSAFSRADLVVDRGTGRVLSKRVFPPRDLCGRVYEGTLRCDPAAARTNRALVPAEYEGRPVVPDPAVSRVLAPAVEGARALRTEPLGVTAASPIGRIASGDESPLGNLFTDAMLAAVPGADVALNNTRGGLRADLPAGPLTFGHLFEVFPFENRLVTVELTGAEIVRVFRQPLERGRALPGLTGVAVRAACVDGALQVTVHRPSGEAIGPDERLTIVTTDFLATGGDGILAPILPSGGFPVGDDLPLARDVVADWLRRRGGTLTEAELIDTASPRWQYPGSLPIRCE